MTDLHEIDYPRNHEEYIPLSEIDAHGIGALYVADSDIIDRLAVYMGDGLFKGVSPEIRSGARSIRLGLDDHKDNFNGDALRPYVMVGSIDEAILDKPAAITAILLPMMVDHYRYLLENNIDISERMSTDQVRDRLHFYEYILKCIEDKECIINEPDGSVYLSDTVWKQEYHNDKSERSSGVGYAWENLKPRPRK